MKNALTGRSYVMIFCNAFRSGGDAAFLLPELRFWRERGFRVVLFSANKPEKELLPPDDDISLEELASPGVTFPALLRTFFSLLGRKMFYREMLDMFRVAPNPKNIIVAVKKHWQGLAVQRQLENKLRELNIRPDDTVVLYSYWLEYFSLAAAECPVPSEHVLRIARAHGYDLYDNQPGNGYMPWRRARITKTDRVFTASLYGANYLRQRFPGLREKISCSRIGSVDFGARPYLPSHELRIVSCSHIVPVKRIGTLIRTLSQIREIPVCWTHIGSGSGENSLKELAAEILPGNIRVNWAGFCSHEEVKRIFQTQDFDLFVSVSASEGLPVSMMEALSCGIPILATAVGGVPEIVRPGRSGWLLPPDVPEKEFRRAVSSYLEMKEPDRIRLRESCRKLWESDFDPKINHGLFLDRVRTMLGRSEEKAE